MNEKIEIDPVFKMLIPPLSDEERKQLEANIIAEKGCRDPLVRWKETSILLDGHNRHEICTRLGLGFRVVDVSFPDRESAADWIDRNQLGRRNLKDEYISLLRGRLYQRAKKREGGSGRNQHTEELGQSGLVPPTAEKPTEMPVALGSTAARLAEQFGISERTIKRDGAFADAVETVKTVDPEIEQKVMAGTVPSKAAVIQAAQAIDSPEQAKAILNPVETTQPEKPWAAFETGMLELISDQRKFAHRLRDLLEADGKAKTLGSKWAKYYSHAGTIGQVNALIRSLEDGMPAEVSSRDGHGYISAGRLEILNKSKAA